MILRLVLFFCLVLIVIPHDVVAAKVPQQRQCVLEQEHVEHPILCSKVQQLLENPESIRKELQEWATDHGLIVTPPLPPPPLPPPPPFSAHEDATESSPRTSAYSQMPVVLAHGMGDSCFNDGMQLVAERISSLLSTDDNNKDEQVYSVCIPTGDSLTEDTNNGYFLNMNANVDIFVRKVRADPRLSQGFHAVGFSQGNNVIRGYIARYNDPPVHSWISVNGVNAGQGAVPYCRPSATTTSFHARDGTITTTTTTATTEIPGAIRNDIGTATQRSLRSTPTTTIPFKGSSSSVSSSLTLTSSSMSFHMCDLLMEQASRAAYTTYAQHHSFQANYWRDPRVSEFPTYQKYAQLADWNNEGLGDNDNKNKNKNKNNHLNKNTTNSYKENWSRTQVFVWVMATQDEMVWPKEGEQWGAPATSSDQNPFTTIVPRNETKWYTEDLFGLRTAEEHGKNHYEQFDGNHLQFDWTNDFDRWITTYLE